ncbi:uncharacterized protein at4g06598 [Phtheirospermum japonicum]|uniref:Uncharacterized protein at4g06598 n=1 Tax=Phtheirospermum japonicum TaxID=374723 RepID=A0A830CP30_9LAMI|nr:uncharacterized protein at4g06598 [Phtheirospermum japonicum]
MLYNGKNSLLPPKSPFPSISPSYTDYIPTSAIGPKTLPKPRDINPHHQRTSSESFLIDEQPSWLDELLDEPETPVRRGGHRRSSSDSFTYIDMPNVGTQDENINNNNRYKNMGPLSSWGSQDFDIYRDARQSAFYMDLNNFGKTRNKMWDPPALLPNRGHPSHRGNALVQNVGGGSLSTSQDADKNPDEKRDMVESGHQDHPKGPAEKKDSSHAKSSETDNKRAKQYAELEFVNQQNLILSMENKALKQRLDSLAQEQLIKYCKLNIHPLSPLLSIEFGIVF